MSRITTPPESERIWDDACREIEGELNPETGQFEVTNWPKPRVSNPHFLSDLLEDWKKDQK